ncbi:MAG: histidine phosphatase family protein [Acidobacteriia bacterium]|nr:histidine phosphatase family protein [Terriglobia bacterium]
MCGLLLCALLARPAAGALTVVLVRHAETAAPSATDPPLSAGGRKRAELLAAMLAGAGVDAIYATEYQRTQQTAQPLAERLHITTERIAARDTKAFGEAIRRRETGVVVVVGHSNTIPAIVAELGGPAVTIGETEFDNLFILTMSRLEVSLLRMRYGEGPAAGVPAVARGTAMLEERNPVMQIKFVRSGGFAGAATNVEGAVTFDETGAQVTSEASQYRRALAAEEAGPLRTAADPAALAGAKGALSAPAGAMRDGYQYDITVVAKDGKSHAFTLHDGPSDELKNAAPGIANLAGWVQEEARKIWTHRIKQR